MILVKIFLKETSQPIIHNAKNTYSKGKFFCVQVLDEVFKYPISNIFRVIEDYEYNNNNS